MSVFQEINMKDMVKILSVFEERVKRKFHSEGKLQMSSPMLQKYITLPSIFECGHISFVTPDRIWASDYHKLIFLDSATSDEQYCVKNSLGSYYEKHTINSEGELIYIDKKKTINRLSCNRKTSTVLIKYRLLSPRCVYCSPSTGDLLVGVRDLKIGKLMRYDNTGRHIKTIPQKNTPFKLYEEPLFITENNNRDVVVSDIYRAAVVVTSRKGVHRFTYTGPPPSGSRLLPLGVCTDALSQILVCDNNTDTVQVISQDGQFLKYLLTEEQSPRIYYRPLSLSYDIHNHFLWVGSVGNNKLCVYRYINRDLSLSPVSLIYCSLILKFSTTRLIYFRSKHEDIKL